MLFFLNRAPNILNLFGIEKFIMEVNILVKCPLF